MVIFKLLVVYFWHMTSKYAFTHIGMSKYPESSNSCPQKSRLPTRLMQQQIKHAFFLSSERCLYASASVFSPDYANRLMYSTLYSTHMSQSHSSAFKHDNSLPRSRIIHCYPPQQTAGNAEFLRAS